MGRFKACVGTGALLAGLLGAAPAADGPVRLRERAEVAGAGRVVAELTASGTLQPEGDPAPKPIPVAVKTRFAFDERVVALGPDGAPRKAVRHVRQAAAAIGGGGRPLNSLLRPEVSLLVAEGRDGEVFTFSPGGPLTRSELDLVQTSADPLLLGGLLPEAPVGLGETWPIGPLAARALTDYEALAANTLRGKLEALDADTATIRVAGSVRGAVRGGEGTMACDGTLVFDRRANRVAKLSLKRDETRAAGQVEPALQFTGTLTLTREALASPPPELTDAALAGVPLSPPEGLDLLEFVAPDGRYRLLHDRAWHLFWDDSRLAVLKRLDRGELVAQCNLAVGPEAGPGRHQDPAQFRADVQKALGTRFGRFAGAGELDDADGTYRYKVAVQGREGEQDVLWYYYLIAGPSGAQLLGTFTLNAADQKRFGEQDLKLVGSLRWGDPKAPAAPPAGR
jgi:hypothetical protein